jgi:hypothetical protein
MSPFSHIVTAPSSALQHSTSARGREARSGMPAACGTRHGLCMICGMQYAV